MKRRILLLGMLLFCTTAGWSQVYQQSIRQGMVKVKLTPEMASTLSQSRLRPGTTLSTGIQPLDVAAQRTGAKNMYRLFPYNAKIEAKLHKHGLDLWYVVEIDEKSDPKDAVSIYKKVSGVALAEVDHQKVVSPFQVQEAKGNPVAPMEAMPFNDPYLPSQWHYHNTGQGGYSVGCDVNLFEAWKVTAGKRDVIVSIHDQGVDIAHKDLADNIWTNIAEANGAPNVDDDGNGYIDDVHGWNFDTNTGQIDAQLHGTHVAGTIAAVNNNGFAVSGVAGGTGNKDGALVMSLQTLGGGSFESSYVYAASNGAVISQNSWGYTNPDSYDQSVLDAIDYFIAEAGNYPGSPMKGGIVIFASGNSNTDQPFYPAYHPSTLAVNSIGPDFKRAYYSNYGTWTDVTSTGGNTDLGGTSGVLSTLPNNKVGYLQGTSMACPHVSGIAALALANRTHQMTPGELRNKIVTGVVDIDSYNPDFAGLLGAGLTDAKLIIQNDAKIAPAAIGDLKIASMSQESAILSWSVPADEDDGRPVSYTVYYQTTPFISGNLSQADKVSMNSKHAVGEPVTLEVTDLTGLTTYYFAVVAIDRWGNASALSNVATSTTNDGPTIAVDDNSKAISLSIDASTGATATHGLQLFNNGEGFLRWSGITRSKEHNTTFLATGLNYPVVSKVKAASSATLVRRAAHNTSAQRNKVSTMAFEGAEINYGWGWPIYMIGETDTTLTNSAATKFQATDDAGFNLTHVQMWLRQNSKNGPIIIEIYKGESPTKKNLVLAQEYNVPPSEYDYNQVIQLTEQIFFEKGETFWIAFHVPSGILYPLGLAEAQNTLYAANCLISFDLGATWASLPQTLHDERYVWATVATSYSEDLGKYLTLEPAEGELEGHTSSDVLLTADGSKLMNGSYTANVILQSNDSKTKELRIPVDLTVTGQAPVLQSTDVLDFGSVFYGKTKELTLTISNAGYGNFEGPTATLSDPQFEIVGGAPWQIAARDQVDLLIRFTPTGPGNVNATLNLTSGDFAYTVVLFGVGTEASKIKITPVTQTIDNLALGDQAKATVNVENTGKFALKYFIPGFDSKGVGANWPDAYHTYGYAKHNSVNDPNPIAYTWTDISATGTEISSYFKSIYNQHYEVGLDFDFPFYAEKTNKVYITSMGMITLDNTVNVVNTPRLRDSYGPIGMICATGLHFTYQNSGKIFFQKQSDRLIVQYDHVNEGEMYPPLTFQIVLFDNGNIRMYYNDVSDDPDYMRPTTALVEDRAKEDGILFVDWETNFTWQDGMAFGLDYPGPSIISSVENGSGIVMPGQSQDVVLTLDTKDLYEGAIDKNVTFINNDPFNSAVTANVKLNITSGGKAKPTLSTTSIAFGSVFAGAIKSQQFVVRNDGTADLQITNAATQLGRYTLTGASAITLTPKHATVYTVTIPTGTLRSSLTDKVIITYADGSKSLVSVTGSVVAAPAITVDLTAVDETLTHGETKTLPFSIKNTGAAALELAVSGSEWAITDIADVAVTTLSIPDNTYTWRSSKDDTGPAYQWVDLVGKGEFIDPNEAMDPDDESKYWTKVDLGWSFKFYGVDYTSLYIGVNGVISFDADQPWAFWSQSLPTADAPNNIIAPLWVPGGFDTYYNPETSGIFYKVYDDKIIISFERMVNAFGMGDPISVQAILYKNGSIKYQYHNTGQPELVSQFGVVGVENKTGTEGVEVSAYHNLEIPEEGLAYVLTPATKRTLPAGKTLSGTLTLDATNLYAGEYKTSLHINSNAPNRESLDKPVTLTVLGQATFVADEVIDFGEVMAYTTTYGDGSTGPMGYQKEFTVSNTGTANLILTGLALESGDGTMALEVLVNGMWGPEWTPIEWLNTLPILLPEQTAHLRVDIAPDGTVATLADNVVITTETDVYKIPVTGTVILPPVLDLNKAPVKVSFNLPTETVERTVTLGNPGGKSDLKYELSIDYKRAPQTAATATNETITLSAKAAVLSKESAPSEVTPLDEPGDFNRVLKYEEAEKADGYLGFSGAEEFTSSTRFNGGDKGFNLTHVQTYFRPTELTTGTIEVEIRAGGTTVVNAVSLLKMSTTFNAPPPGAGQWITIALDKAQRILPNEDFYVLLTFPMELQHPQGYVKNSETSENRFMFLSEGIWADVQTYPYADFHDFGWLVRAAETTYESSAWVFIENETSGTLAADNSHPVNLKFIGGPAVEGDQKADLVVRSNDPYKSLVTVPLQLHMNQAPLFTGLPTVITSIAEMETLDMTLSVKDPENNTFTVTAGATYPRLTYSITDNVLTLQYKPDYTDAGTHEFVFEAKDEFGASRTVTVNVMVDNTNRAPKFAGTTHDLSYNGKGAFDEQNLATFFTDPDGDALTFTVSTGDEAIANVFAADDKFIVKPMAVGETKLAFAITDSNGAVLKDTLTVTVNNILGLEQPVNQGLKVYPNPVQHTAHVLLSSEWHGNLVLEVMDASGKLFLLKQTEAVADGLLLDVSSLQKGFYLLRVTAKDKHGVVKLIKD
ncbi:S8 family serine peptidase [Chryseolinea soli]|nr:S8 family serine peptidase [Chryseolinea soli]